MNAQAHAIRFGSSREFKFKDEKQAIKKGILSYHEGKFLAFSPYTGKPLFAVGDFHTYISGGSGCGKSTCNLSPILLGMGGIKNAVINDPKAELLGVIAPLLYQRGIKAFSLNSFGLLSNVSPYYSAQHAYNFLKPLDPNSVHFFSDAGMYAQAIIVADKNARDRHFDEKARFIINIFIVYIKTALPNANMVDLRHLLDIVISDFDSFKMLVEKDFPRCPFDSVATVGKELVAMRENSPREYTGILSTLTRNLSWLSDPAIQKAVVGDDFDPSVLAKDCYVFLNMPPEYAEKYASLTRLFFASFMIAKQRNPSGNPVHYLMDEAGMMGSYFEEMERMYMIGRGYGNLVTAAFQHNAQAEVYRGGANGLMSSAGIQLFMGVNDLATAKMLSELLGQATFEYSNIKNQELAAIKAHENRMKLLNGNYDILTDGRRTRYELTNAQRVDRVERPLKTVDEILKLGHGKLIALVADLPPMILDKRPYWTIPQLAGRYIGNPYRPPFHKVTVQERFFRRTRKVVLKPCPEHLAHFPQHQSGYYVELV